MPHNTLSLLAYLDPGTGSIVLQMAIAGLLSAGIVFRQYLFAPFFALFGKRKSAAGEGDVAAGGSGPEIE